MKNSYDGRSRGCGIVEFQTSDEAQAAINTMNNTEIQGRPISVQADRGTQRKTSSKQNRDY
jgi:RNA recognition motif-containing protein